MNYLEIESRILAGEKIYNIPLRVCFYARVSTDSEVQLNSLENQLDYYENYIKSINNWTFAGGYTDEGITGVSIEKRDAFKKMIRDAKNHRFDMIITKEVSRFARDLEDSIHYIRKLREANVGVFFENQNLNTFDPNSELILNIMFNLAQEESRKLSSRIKFGHREAIKKGHVLGSSNIIGYRKENCKLVIVNSEAKLIRKIFELYATGKYGLTKLSMELTKWGYYNKHGRIYDKDTLKRVIMNPKYKGFYRGHTYEILDYRTKRRKVIPIEEQVLYKCVDGSIPAIVSEELWNKANEILSARTLSYRNNNYWSGGLKYAFSSKIYCKEDNTNYQRSHGSVHKDRPVWSCKMYQKYRIEKCISPIIAERDLYNIMSNIMDNIIPKDNSLINNMLDFYINIDKTNKYQEDLETIETNIKNIELKKSKAIDLIIKGVIREEDLIKQFEEFKKELKDLTIKKQDVMKQINIIQDSNFNITKISNAIEREINGELLEEFIRKFVTEILVSKQDDNRNDIVLDIFLNLSGEEKPKIRGARHINGPSLNDKLYIENQKCDSLEKHRRDRIENKFTYNVYVESL